METKMERILNELKNAGYDYGVAIATQAEINAGAACGQLSIIVEQSKEWYSVVQGGHWVCYD